MPDNSAGLFHKHNERVIRHERRVEVGHWKENDIRVKGPDGGIAKRCYER